MVADQEEIHRLSTSFFKEDRHKAINEYCNSFYLIHDKDKYAAWENRILLTSDKDYCVRKSAVLLSIKRLRDQGMK